MEISEQALLLLGVGERGRDRERGRERAREGGRQSKREMEGKENVIESDDVNGMVTIKFHSRK